MQTIETANSKFTTKHLTRAAVIAALYVVLTYLGFCMNNKAATIEGDIPAQKALYKESMRYLERARDIDPDRMKANWAYPLYQCYYINYSANDPRTKEMEDMLKQ